MTNDRQRPRNLPGHPVGHPVPSEQSKGHGSLVVVQERVLADIAHELGNFFHKLYYWSDYIKGDAGQTGNADSTAGQMLERTISNLEDFLKVALEYFHPVKLNLSRIAIGELLEGFMVHLGSHVNGNQVQVLRDDVGEPASILVDPTRIAQVFRVVLHKVQDDLKSGGTLTVSVGRAQHHDFAGLEMRLEIQPKVPSSPLLRTPEVGVEWAVAQKIIEMHGGEVSERYEPSGVRVVLIFLPLYV